MMDEFDVEQEEEQNPLKFLNKSLDKLRKKVEKGKKKNPQSEKKASML